MNEKLVRRRTGGKEADAAFFRTPTSLFLLSSPRLFVPCGITYLLPPLSLPFCKAIRASDSDGDYKTAGAASPPKQSVFQLLFFQGLAPPGVP